MPFTWRSLNCTKLFPNNEGIDGFGCGLKVCSLLGSSIFCRKPASERFSTEQSFHMTSQYGKVSTFPVGAACFWVISSPRGGYSTLFRALRVSAEPEFLDQWHEADDRSSLNSRAEHDWFVAWSSWTIQRRKLSCLTLFSHLLLLPEDSLSA